MRPSVGQYLGDLLAQEMVDPVDMLLSKQVCHVLCKFLRGRKVPSKRLLNDQPIPAVRSQRTTLLRWLKVDCVIPAQRCPDEWRTKLPSY